MQITPPVTCAVMAALSLSLISGAPAYAQTTADPSPAVTGCAAKIARIEQELEYARKWKNTHKVAGLEQALQSARSCTEESLTAEREEKIKEKEYKVEKKEARLKKKQAKGDAEDIRDAEEDLAEAKKELEEARAALHQ